MRPFAYLRPGSTAEALEAAQRGARFLAGGTNLLDLMKLGIETPGVLVDVNRVAELGEIAWETDGRLRIGAAVRMSALARDGRVADRFPALHQGLLAGATPQLRNMASVGGNLLQRARCAYFRDPSLGGCNKRAPGSGCAARSGVNDGHAILGWTDACVAVHASDLAVALLALDAEVVTDRRIVPLEALHLLPRDGSAVDTILDEGELILAVVITPGPRAQRSAYAKAPPAGGFALASAAVALELADGVIVSARVALGGVAHKPWRAAEAEAALLGRAAGQAVFAEATRTALAPARPLSGNAYKLSLAGTVLEAALAQAAGS